MLGQYPSGVKEIKADENGMYHVVSVDGRIVKIVKDLSEIYDLGKGLYIINGEKIMIR